MATPAEQLPAAEAFAAEALTAASGAAVVPFTPDVDGAVPSATALTVGVDELRDRGAIAALRPQLERLAAAMAAAGQTKGPFLTPEWMAITAAALTDGRAEG